jgi:hypothetical protein
MPSMLLARFLYTSCLLLAIGFLIDTSDRLVASENDPGDKPAEPKSPTEWYGLTIRT